MYSLTKNRTLELHSALVSSVVLLEGGDSICSVL